MRAARGLHASAVRVPGLWDAGGPSIPVPHLGPSVVPLETSWGCRQPRSPLPSGLRRFIFRGLFLAMTLRLSQSSRR